MLNVLPEYESFSNVRKRIEELGGSYKKIEKKILRTIATILKNKIRKAFKQLFKIDKETDKEIIGVSKKQHIAFVGIIGRKQYKFQPHEYGKTIIPKKGKNLMFNIGNSFIKTKSVTIPRKPFYFNTVDNYVENNMEKDMAKVLEREVKKIWEGK